ncbi:hypothetical protein FA09DRAFT_330591 [Tilletiopsis washingtonensis]|uniref:C4-dicarboxylate transporter/malic acid transport protein n=1 Tax=Tilletiopsis washingtonensis TaxID=58919 RepID=A0A316Z6L8_9BASI|nr:hypothetical protein FA09DRAFT_330591 [Tilletiopsis washingtonensis]PWN97430.1 hypothetical protein FA09DRAFT_330591 [Tilletiopsis washingtonensis]
MSTAPHEAPSPSLELERIASSGALGERGYLDPSARLSLVASVSPPGAAAAGAHGSSSSGSGPHAETSAASSQTSQRRTGPRQEEKKGPASMSAAASPEDDVSKPPAAAERGNSQPPKRSRGVRERILNFTPSWFSVSMGTGGVHILLLLLGDVWAPYSSDYTTSPHASNTAALTLPTRILRWFALPVLLVNICIFTTFIAAFTSRYIMFPAVLPLTLKHPQKSVFIGTLPMALLTIVSTVSQIGTRAFDLGLWPTLLAVSLWFLAVVLSLACAVVIPYMMMIHQRHLLEGTTASLLLPVVPPITAAATGAGLVEILTRSHPSLAFTVLTISYICNGVGLMLALMILVLYFQRLLLFHQPAREVIISVFLPLGPCGQGAEALLHLGQASLYLFPTISTLPGSGVPQLSFPVGQALYGAGLIGALHLVGLGCWFMFLAVAIVIREQSQGKLPFSLGWWAATFPLASLLIGIGRCAMVLDSLTLRIIFTILCGAYGVIYFSVAIPTARGFITGHLLVAPCLADLPLDPLRKYRDPREDYDEAKA